ncbi:DNA polymerase subunit gamma-2, mitochondrial isoform X2 [Homalodisca vitripennis]|uniref:DNA polymerase subunit gamma-2, mitochondrial isoform X2 n=1 Tax=Homalodisca vitripennis TaxID=197043 RepID=UPI001EEA7E9B|nr:DNA polymerase subunit gamma-2, mitochondrial isoform X2 [Homalodisca vitripennis]
MSEHLRKILELSTKLGFFKMVESNNVKTISFGPLAILLANNIHNEWFRSNVINSELNTFLYESNPDHTWQEDSQLAYNQLLQANSEQLPFGLASAFQTCMPTKANEDKDSQLQGMTHCQTKGYRHLVFISEKDSQKYFYRLQLKRRIWWRKFSTDPERFQISEYKTGEHGEYVQISAKFPFTTEVVETIHNHSSSLLNGYGSLFETQPARAVLRLHHSLAPYKVALAVDPREDRLEELGQLATFLCLNLRKEGVHTLFISSSRSKKTKEAQLGFHDSIGIPYTVVVNAESLINGIVGLRSRDTTLQEQVHVSKLTSYMQRLLS